VVLYAGIGNEKPSAVGIGAPNLLGHGFCLQGKTMTLVRASMLRKDKNQIRRRWVTPLQGEEEYPREVFCLAPVYFPNPISS
jgi:hypothetical protein